MIDIRDKTGDTCVGDLRLSPLDIGFDIRIHGIEVRLPKQFDSVGFEENGKIYLITGSRHEMIKAIKKAGYKIYDEFK